MINGGGGGELSFHTNRLSTLSQAEFIVIYEGQRSWTKRLVFRMGVSGHYSFLYFLLFRFLGFHSFVVVLRCPIAMRFPRFGIVVLSPMALERPT